MYHKKATRISFYSSLLTSTPYSDTIKGCLEDIVDAYILSPYSSIKNSKTFKDKRISNRVKETVIISGPGLLNRNNLLTMRDDDIYSKYSCSNKPQDPEETQWRHVNIKNARPYEFHEEPNFRTHLSSSNSEKALSFNYSNLIH